MSNVKARLREEITKILRQPDIHPIDIGTSF